MFRKKDTPDDVSPEMAADIQEGLGAPEMPMTVEDEVIALRGQMAGLEQELAEAKNAYLRAHADFDNFRKRLRAERDQEFARGSDRVINDLLSIVDDFQRALTANGAAGDSFRHGVDLIYKQLQALLERYGVTPMAVEGQPFDPKFHDAVARVATAEQPEYTIVGEVQRGYLKNGEVFRPAKVAVAVTPDA